MEKSLISVVLGSYNRYEFLKLTIDSVRKELADVAHEIIVVDGGSTDGAMQWLLEQKDIITIVQHNRGEWLGKNIERRSWGYFMNLGFRAASSKYVCMISDDCLIIPGAIKNGYNLFEERLNNNEKIGAIAFYWRDWSKENTFHVNYTLGNKMYVNHGMYLKNALKEVDYIDDQTYFFYNGDGDLCLKIWEKGYQVIDSENSYIEHYPHAQENVRKTNYKKYNSDLKKYLERWKNIFYDPIKDNKGGGKLKYFDDLTKMGEKFLLLHNEVIKENPSLFKKKLTTVFTNKIKWKMNALRLKYLRFINKFKS